MKFKTLVLLQITYWTIKCMDQLFFRHHTHELQTVT